MDGEERPQKQKPRTLLERLERRRLHHDRKSIKKRLPPPSRCLSTTTKHTAAPAEEEDRACVCYAMGFGLQTPDAKEDDDSLLLWQIPPMVVAVVGDAATTIELLLVARAPLPESEWRTHVAARIRHVQTHELVTTTVHGTACAARLLQLQKTHHPSSLPLSCSAVEARVGGSSSSSSPDAALSNNNALLDAYRLLSNGRMHPDDTRSWCMTVNAMTELRADMLALIARMRQRVDERTDVARLVEYGEGVIETARLLAHWHNYHPMHPWLLEQQRMEVSALEARELELLHAIELDRKEHAALDGVYVRQRALRCARYDARKLAKRQQPQQPPASAA